MRQVCASDDVTIDEEIVGPRDERLREVTVVQQPRFICTRNGANVVMSNVGKKKNFNHTFSVEFIMRKSYEIERGRWLLRVEGKKN